MAIITRYGYLLPHLGISDAAYISRFIRRYVSSLPFHASASADKRYSLGTREIGEITNIFNADVSTLTGKYMSTGELVFLALMLFAGAAYADCANEAMGVGAYIDARDSGVTYGSAKQQLHDKKKKISKSEFAQISRLLKIAYESIPAKVSSVEGSQIVFNLCKEMDKSTSPSDICFATAYGVGMVALGRDRGATSEKLIIEISVIHDITRG